MGQNEFDLESSLVDVLHSNRHGRWLFRHPTELLIFPEVQVGSIIPDLVIVRQVRGQLGSRPVRLTLFESWIIGELLRRGRLREKTLTRRLFTREPDMKAALKRLTNRGLIKQTRVGTYTVHTDFSCRFEVVSVEAKLQRWRHAIDQAKRYLRFSNRSYIALPASIISANDNIAEVCEHEGIGLIAVHKDAVRVEIHPEATEPDLREWTWLLAKTGCLRV